MTYNKKLMWKCINYSKSKCHSRIHTFDGRIIFNSDKHNHLPHSLEADQSVFHSQQAQSSQKTVYTDGHDFIGRTFTTPECGDLAASGTLAVKQRTSLDTTNITAKLSLTKNICQNLQRIKSRASEETMNSGSVTAKENKSSSIVLDTKPAVRRESLSDTEHSPSIDLSRMFSDSITEVPNSLGKLTKCAIKQEIVTCTPEIC